MTEEQQKLVLQQCSTIGAITSELQAGRPVENWAQKIQGCVDIIAATVQDATDWRGRR